MEPPWGFVCTTILVDSENNVRIELMRHIVIPDECHALVYSRSTLCSNDLNDREIMHASTLFRMITNRNYHRTFGCQAILIFVPLVTEYVQMTVQKCFHR